MRKLLYRSIAVGMTGISLVAGFQLYQEWFTSPWKAVVVVAMMECSRVVSLFTFTARVFVSVSLPAYLVVSVLCSVVAVTSFALDFEKKEAVEQARIVEYASKVNAQYQERVRAEIQDLENRREELQRRIHRIETRGQRATSTIKDRDDINGTLREVRARSAALSILVGNNPLRAVLLILPELGETVDSSRITASRMRQMIDAIGINFYAFQIIVASLLVVTIEVSIVLAALAANRTVIKKKRLEPAPVTVRRKPPAASKSRSISSTLFEESLREALIDTFGKSSVMAFQNKYRTLLSEGKLPPANKLSITQRRIRTFLESYEWKK